jgi:hypothetical protein
VQAVNTAYSANVDGEPGTAPSILGLNCRLDVPACLQSLFRTTSRSYDRLTAPSRETRSFGQPLSFMCYSLEFASVFGLESQCYAVSSITFWSPLMLNSGSILTMISHSAAAVCSLLIFPGRQADSGAPCGLAVRLKALDASLRVAV